MDSRWKAAVHYVYIWVFLGGEIVCVCMYVDPWAGVARCGFCMWIFQGVTHAFGGFGCVAIEYETLVAFVCVCVFMYWIRDGIQKGPQF